jgi:hypothetical protein
VLDRLSTVALWNPRSLILLAVLAVWGHSVSFGFVWDDYFFIETNESVRSLSQIPRMFTELRAQSSFPDGFMVFRPLRTAHYALLHLAGGGQLRPALFHAANLAWHAAAAMLLFATVLRLLRWTVDPGEDGERRARALALISGLAFAVHPVLSETVCWAKCLDDIMAAVFVLLATNLLLAWRGGWPGYAGMAAAFLAALYSKESAVPWVAFAGLAFWSVHGLGVRRAALLTAPLSTLALLALWHRHWVMGRSSQAEPISGTHLQTLVDMLPTVAPYARLVLGIPPFCIDYSYMKGGYALASLAVLGGAALLLAALGLAVWALTRPRWRVAGLGGAWVLLFMLPVSNLVPMMQYMAERFLYLPLAGCVFAAAGAVVHARRQSWVTWTAAGVLAIWAVTAWNRSWIWEDELALFLTTRLEAPPMSRVDDNTIAAFLKQPHMRHVFELVPQRGSLPRIALAPAAQRAHADWPLVVATLRELARQFPSSPIALEPAGAGLVLAGLPEEGAMILERVVALNPHLPGLWRSLGQARFEAGEFTGAIAPLERALEMDPSDTAALGTLARALMKTGDRERATAMFDRLIELEYGSDEPHQ